MPLLTTGMIKRRDFLKAMAVSGSAALLDGCSPAPSEKLIPYLVPPDDVVPGVPAYYATVCRECPAGCGMFAKIREGRAIKAEGNPRHPVGEGGLCVRGQSSLQSLYNPDRFRGPMAADRQGGLRQISWEEAEERLASRLREVKGSGRGSRIAWVGCLLTGSLERLTREWLKALGSERRLFYETFEYESLRRASEIAFGRPEIPTYRLGEAQFLISFGADFLETWLSNVELASAFAKMRKKRPQQHPDNFVCAGPRLSMTGSNADWWIPLAPGTEIFLVLSMVNSILEQRLAAEAVKSELKWIESLVAPFAPGSVQSQTGVSPTEVAELARRFGQARPSLALGGGVTAAGEQAVSLELAVLLLNAVAGNVGKTVLFGAHPALGHLATYQDLLDLVEDMNRGNVDVLFLHHTNPAFTLPEACGFPKAMENVSLVVSFSSMPDETAAKAHLVLPDHHFLESWGDHSPRDGVFGIQQPVMRPIFDTRATGDVLLNVARKVDSAMASQFDWPDFHNWIQSYWNFIMRPRLAPQLSWEQFWPDVLKNGGSFSEVPPARARLRNFSKEVRFEGERLEGPADGHPLVVYPSAHFFDGRNANNPWLQEIPDPVTKLVWDGWVEVHPDRAHKIGLTEGDLVELRSPHGSVTVAAHLYAGLHPEVLAMPLGQGRWAPLRYAAGRGANPMRLISPRAAPVSGAVTWRSVRIALSKTGRRRPLTSLQAYTEEKLPPVAQFFPEGNIHGPDLPPEKPVHPVDYYPPHAHPEHRWGMAIDLDACQGCNACVAACYAENNVAVVGHQLCAQGREMSWIRIERYEQSHSETGNMVRLEVASLPMLCQHCDQAPCEPVCPVFATYHNPEGLNAQVYNRCVGTRYCSNNCPYKVRRFNWTTYPLPEPLHLQLNPDVTVRTMGVMEKCTFCIQRIHQGKNRARREDRPLRDGDITPSCAQTCPAEAIVFGDLNDPHSRVSALAKDPRGYRVLESLNTRPAVTYLKKVVPTKAFSGA